MGGSDKILGIWREVFGQIDGSSTDPLDPGSGDWTLDGDLAGTWTITIDPAFDNVPTVIASENQSTTLPPSFIQVFSVSVDTIVILTYQTNGTLGDDIGFNFLALSTFPD